MKILNIVARQILDSRGNPTVEADVFLEGGAFGRASVPSGASTGVHEAHELRDGGKEFGGLGVKKAVNNIIKEILPVLKGVRADDQFLIDQKMIDLDGTPNKSRLGANATLAVSLAVAHAASKARGVLLYKQINDIALNPTMSLPLPMMNVLNGGRHASGSSDFQEFMIIPRSVDSFAGAVQMGAEIFQSLKRVLSDADLSTAVGDEGGFTVPIRHSNTEMLDVLNVACRAAGYEPGEDVSFAMDVAASEFYAPNLRKISVNPDSPSVRPANFSSRNVPTGTFHSDKDYISSLDGKPVTDMILRKLGNDGEYTLNTESRKLNSTTMSAYLEEIAYRYPVVSIEDGLSEDDWDGWVALTKVLGNIQLVGDDLLVTNPERLQHAINLGAGNAILIKPNQIGTLSETIRTIQLAKDHGFRTIVSHRSGETEDVTIAHLAVGTGADQIKTGSMSRSERTAKYNELMRLEELDSSLKLAKPFNF